MHKVIKTDPLINLVNYMSDQFSSHGDFLFRGFVPLHGEYFGLYNEGVHYAAIHLSTVPIRKVRSEEEKREAKMIQSGMSWLAVIYGSDNTSYMKRFHSKKRMENWFYKTEKLVRDDTWLYYNS